MLKRPLIISRRGLDLSLNVKVDAALVSLLVFRRVPEPLDSALTADVASRRQGVGDGDVEIGYISTVSDAILVK